MATTREGIRRIWEKIGEPMEATNHLHDTRMFRTAIYGPAIAALIVGLIGYFFSPVEADWTLNGFNNFIALFKLPIGMASLAIPFGALIASHHRSIQSARQIESQQQQHTFSNYIKHKEYFGKFLDDEGILDGSYSFAAKEKKVYQALFPNARKGYLDFEFEWIEKQYLTTLIANLKAEVGKVTWDNREHIGSVLNDVAELKQAIADEFELEIVDLIINKDIETLSSQVQNLGITMSHLYSASTFFSENESTQEIYDWSIKIKVLRHSLDVVKNFDYAQQRIKEIALNAMSSNMAPLNQDQRSDLLRLLGKESGEKLKSIRQNLSELPTADEIVKQLEEFKYLQT
ncbi:hypothetical protein [uncultured Marinobacter sp.]|uniref:hypothetical protein n=1 Tax=uncultured Marinobacter sp. TaxID=187379 RepID=UPI0025CE2F3B|nr:hypothetical protein [uncultured Marinobacter sp.]